MMTVCGEDDPLHGSDCACWRPETAVEANMVSPRADPVVTIQLDLECLEFLTDILESYEPRDEVTKEFRHLLNLCTPKPHFYAYFTRGEKVNG